MTLERPGVTLSPPEYTPSQLRAAVRATAATYLSVPVSQLPSVPSVAAALRVPETQVPTKAQRYAVAGALSSLIVAAVVEGDGPQARLRTPLPTEPDQQYPIADLYHRFAYDFMAEIAQSEYLLTDADGPQRDRAGWLIETYDAVMLTDPAANQTRAPADAAMMFRGTEAPWEISRFMLCVTYACARHPELATAPAAQLLEAARQLCSVIIGRASSNVAVARDWSLVGVDAERLTIKTYPVTDIDGEPRTLYRFDDDGQFLRSPLPGSPPAVFPTIRCPAHMAKTEASHGSSALLNLIYAGLNEGLDRGLFDTAAAVSSWEDQTRDRPDA